MSAIALATVQTTSEPPSRATLLRQLANLQVPPRSAALLADSTTESSVDGPATAAIRAGLAGLVSQLAGGVTDATRYQRSVAGLVGLGPGLTPTGDDVLVALVAMSRRLAAGGLLLSSAADSLASAVATCPAGRTTAIAEHLLHESAEDRFPEPLAAFVGALGDPGVDQAMLAALLDRLAATGAHSGADWIAGVIALARVCVTQGGDRWPSA